MTRPGLGGAPSVGPGIARPRARRAGAKLGAGAAFALALLGWAAPSLAHHVPAKLDVPVLWAALADDGYLDFMTPSRPIPIKAVPATKAMGVSGILGEEHTGYTTPEGLGMVDHPDDNDMVAGDRADFDWVQEHRPDETGVSYGGTNHPGPGAMGWTIAPTSPSPHSTGGRPHEHSAAETPPGPLPSLAGADFQGPRFNVVDVFSVIAEGEDKDEGGRREAALDYELWFVDLGRGISTQGVAVMIFERGWSEGSTAEDYVARWVPATPGTWDAVVIDPPFGFGHDKVTEIDAIRAAPRLELPISMRPAPVVAQRRARSERAD